MICVVQMRHLAAYLLLQIGGNASPSAKDVKDVLASVGIEADEDRLESLISELDGKDVNAVSSTYPSSAHVFTILRSSLPRVQPSSPLWV